MKLLKKIAAVIALLFVAVLALRFVFPLPDISERAESKSIAISSETKLGRVILSKTETHPGKSGIEALLNGKKALDYRIALADMAEQSLDVQYYIWHDDVSGILLMDALKRASERGVRVRLLLDDNGIPGLDGLMSTMSAMDNFEVRLFNPSIVRRPKLLGYAFHFMRMNRRMHNKSFTVDGAATIIGGRNVGDEYFSLKDEFFADLDVLGLGEIVGPTAASFNEYWNSESVYSVEEVAGLEPDFPTYEARLSDVMASQKARDYLAEFPSEADIVDAFERAEWTNAQLVVDDPVKGLGTAKDDQLMINQLGAILGDIEERLDLVSAYFIPGAKGADLFANASRSGVDVNVMTNAFNTTDVTLVHAGYTKYRRELLEAGVDLYEIKLRGGSGEADLQTLPLGLSGAALHAKTFAVDGKKVFIGSFNFDPRSANLNCEMGFLIESENLAKQVHAMFDTSLVYLSYVPKLTPEGRMIWRESRQGNEDLIYQQEPTVNIFSQVLLAVMGALPIEWML